MRPRKGGYIDETLDAKLGMDGIREGGREREGHKTLELARVVQRREVNEMDEQRGKQSINQIGILIKKRKE